jgi:hypothetical protein
MTSPPYARMESTFSFDVFSFVMTMYSYPRKAHVMAIAEPVFPDVAATTVMPGRSRPVRSAFAIMCCAILSLMLPLGFRYSVFAKILTFGFSEYALRSKIGVPPMSCCGDTGEALGSEPAVKSSCSSDDLVVRAWRICVWMVGRMGRKREVRKC